MEQRYQVLPPLSPEEYAALKADIAARGVLVPVEYDEDGHILDGFHRVQICQELGRDWPRAICQRLTEEQKVERALRLNLARRHLAKEHRQQLAIRLRQQGWIQERIADALMISQATVSMWLNEFIKFDKLASPERVHGKDGKRYPSRKTRRTSTQHPHEAEMAEGAVDTPSIPPRKPTQLELLSTTEVPAPASSPVEGQPSTDAAADAAVPRSADPQYAAFDSSSAHATITLEASPRSQPPAPQHELPHVLRLMDELCIALQQRHEEALATAWQGWSLALMHAYVQTCSALMEQLQALQRDLEYHCLSVDTGGFIDPPAPQMPSPHAGTDASPVSPGEAKRVLLEPAGGSGPDRPAGDRQQAVWERLKVLSDQTRSQCRLPDSSPRSDRGDSAGAGSAG
jgi:ParB-like nuclease domain